MEMKDRFQKIYEISLRAKQLFPEIDRVTIMIDIENADKQFNLRLDELLNADEYEFAHDICGIYKNMERDIESPNYGRVGNLFVPRFAERKEEE